MGISEKIGKSSSPNADYFAWIADSSPVSFDVFLVLGLRLECVGI